MFAKVRTGYGFAKANRSYKPGEIVELTDVEYQQRHQIFEAPEVIESKVEKKKEPIPEAVKEEPVLENRAILDTKTASPLIRRGGRKR